MVQLSYYAVPISNLIVLLSHIMVPLFFLKFDGFIVKLSSTNIASDSIFVIFSGTLFFILKFDSSIITLGSTNITTFNRIFVTFGGTLFFLTIDSSVVTVGCTNITFDHNFTFGPTTKVTFLLTNNRSSQ